MTAAAEPRTPDFVWIGCGSCWQPKDRNRPVIFYADYLADPMRHRPFFCSTCTTAQRRHIEVFPSLYAFNLDQGYLYHEGEEMLAPTTVQKFG